MNNKIVGGIVILSSVLTLAGYLTEYLAIRKTDKILSENPDLAKNLMKE